MLVEGWCGSENYKTNSFDFSRPHLASLATHTNSGVKKGVTWSKSYVLNSNLLFLHFNCFRFWVDLCFINIWRNKIGLSTNPLLSIRPAGPAPDLNYFRNNVSHFLKLVSTYMYFSGPMLGYSSNILGVSIKLLLQIDCSLSYSEN